MQPGQRHADGYLGSLRGRFLAAVAVTDPPPERKSHDQDNTNQARRRARMVAGEFEKTRKSLHYAQNFFASTVRPSARLVNRRWISGSIE